MTWDRRELGQKGIFYDETVLPLVPPAALFPAHVEALRRSMLDFSCLITNGNLDSGSDTGRDNSSDLIPPTAHTTLHEALRIHQGGYSEDTWASFFQDHYFKPLASTSRLEGTSRMVSRCNYYYDAFTAGSNKSWKLFEGSVNDSSDLSRFEREKCPKPDYAFYLPMYHLNDKQAIPKVASPKGRQWHNAQEPSLVGNFSWSGLKELFHFGLRPTPFRVFHKPPQEANLNSYPWLLIEHKKEEVSGAERTVCCQAANGAACGVRLNAIAARYAMTLPGLAHIPPLPAVTTIGSKVKVWVAYYAEDFHAPSSGLYYSDDVTWERRKKGTVMRAIWEGDVIKLDDVVKFGAILENTYTWAMRVFKPLMSSYIQQWRHIHCEVGMFVASSEIFRREQTAARYQSVIPMVQDLLDNHSYIEVDDSKHPRVTPMLLGMLVQQIVTSERQLMVDEMERLVNEKLAPLNMGRQTTVPQRPITGTPMLRETSVASEQSTALSLGPTNGDPDDSTYQDSQATGSPKSFAGLFSLLQHGASTHSPSQTRSPIRPATPTPAVSTYDRTLAGRVPSTPDPGHGVHTPLSGSTFLGPSCATTPTANRPLSLESPVNLNTPGSNLLFQRSSPAISTRKAPARTTLFQFPDGGPKWPLGEVTPHIVSSSNDPVIDWSALRRPIKPPTPSNAQSQSSSSKPSVSRNSSEEEEQIEDKNVIDLTNDSQISQ